MDLNSAPADARALSRVAAKTMDALTRGIAIGDAITVDNGRGFMAVHVDALSAASPNGNDVTVYSVAYYYEQNGDLVADPDMTFARIDCLAGDTATGMKNERWWYPLTFSQPAFGIYQVALELQPDGRWVCKPRLARELSAFADSWMANIREQQSGHSVLRDTFPEDTAAEDPPSGVRWGL